MIVLFFVNSSIFGFLNYIRYFLYSSSQSCIQTNSLSEVKDKSISNHKASVNTEVNRGMQTSLKSLIENTPLSK